MSSLLVFISTLSIHLKNILCVYELVVSFLSLMHIHLHYMCSIWNIDSAPHNVDLCMSIYRLQIFSLHIRHLVRWKVKRR